MLDRLVGKQFRRSPFQLWIAIVVTLLLMLLTAWAVARWASGADDGAWLILLALWALLTPACGLLLWDYASSRVAFTDDHVEIKNLASRKRVNFIDIHATQHTAVGTRLLDVKGRTIAEIPACTRSFASIKRFLNECASENQSR